MENPIRKPTDDAVEIRRFSSHADHVVSLQMLRDIEETVAALVRERRSLAWLTDAASRYADFLGEHTLPAPIDDEDGTVASTLLSAEQASAFYLQILDRKMHAAYADPSLRGDHEADIVEEYQRTIEALPLLSAALCALRWAILEHDAELEPAPTANPPAAAFS